MQRAEATAAFVRERLTAAAGFDVPVVPVLAFRMQLHHVISRTGTQGDVRVWHAEAVAREVVAAPVRFDLGQVATLHDLISQNA